MEKSFYYTVGWHDARLVTKKLYALGVPFSVEQASDLQFYSGTMMIVFPNMHVRQYNQVRNVFDCDGKAYNDTAY